MLRLIVEHCCYLVEVAEGLSVDLMLSISCDGRGTVLLKVAWRRVWSWVSAARLGEADGSLGGDLLVLRGSLLFVNSAVGVEIGGMGALTKELSVTNSWRVDPDLGDDLLSHDVDHVDKCIRGEEVGWITLARLGNLELGRGH